MLIVIRISRTSRYFRYILLLNSQSTFYNTKNSNLQFCKNLFGAVISCALIIEIVVGSWGSLIFIFLNNYYPRWRCNVLGGS